MGILSANMDVAAGCLKKSHLQISCTLRATLRFPARSELYMAHCLNLWEVQIGDSVEFRELSTTQYSCILVSKGNTSQIHKQQQKEWVSL